MKDVCNRPQLELVEENGHFLMPKASYSLNRNNQLAVYEWLRTLKLSDGFSSNLATCVESTSSKLIGMSSHDCDIFMQFLLPVAFMFLPSCYWKPLTELSAFFRNLCSTSLRVDKISEMENSIALTLCKLERFFPPALFDCMEHLPVHLPYEARLGGPIQYRWMYPFERFLNHLKSKMKNKRYVEGSIADAYMLEESTHFASFYFDDHVKSGTKIGQNLNDGGINPNLPVTLSIFNQPGRSMGKRKTRYLSAEECFLAHQYVLLNCEEVQPILRLYEKGLRRYNPGCTDQDVDDEVKRNFAHWFKEYTEVHCRRKSTSNFGVSIKGTGLTQFESNCFGTLQEVVEVEYPNDPIKKVVLFKCEWFDPTLNVGSRLNSEYGIAEVHCKKRSKKYNPFIIAQSASQVCYIPYPQGIKEKMNWWVVLNVQPRGTIDSTYSSSYSYQQQNIMLPTYGGSQSIEDDVQDLVHKPLQMNEVELTQSENQGSDERAQTENSEEDDSEEIEEEDNDDFIEDDNPKDNRITIHPIGTTSFDPCSAHRGIVPCLTRTFPKAVRTYNDAPRHVKDVWFNEFRVHIKLAAGDPWPPWMSDLLAQNRFIWDKEDFKKTSEKIKKKNRNLDCRGMGPSLHCASSIPMTKHRRRLISSLLAHNWLPIDNEETRLPIWNNPMELKIRPMHIRQQVVRLAPNGGGALNQTPREALHSHPVQVLPPPTFGR
nr:uncharacterized protein LOC109157962 [Ipomoea trifida]